MAKGHPQGVSHVISQNTHTILEELGFLYDCRAQKLNLLRLRCKPIHMMQSAQH